MERRAVLTSGAVIAGAGIAAVTLAACSGNSASGDEAASAAAPAGSAPAASSGSASSGAQIAQAADVPVGSVFAFQDPQGGPAFLLQPAAGTYLAYSGICTHNGCTVGYDEAAAEFACPCHGARFEVATGEPVQGPAQKPLTKIAVVESGGVVSYA
ncbi:MAG: Rieske (2Fe-2S) protein [Candidatus Nanopelagicales bacterium]